MSCLVLFCVFTLSARLFNGIYLWNMESKVLSVACAHSHQVHISVHLLLVNQCYKCEWPSQKWSETYCKWIFDESNGSIRLKTTMAVAAATVTVAQMSLCWRKINVERQRTDRWLKDLINNLWKAQVHHQQDWYTIHHITFKMGNLPIRRKFDGWTNWVRGRRRREDNSEMTMNCRRVLA